MATQLERPMVTRSGVSIHSTDENEFMPQNEENPLEVAPSSSIQATPFIMQRQNPLDIVRVQTEADEPPPPYQELDDGAAADAPQIAPIEYSVENSPQLAVRSELEFLDIASRNSNQVSSQAPELSPIQSPGSPALDDPSLVPEPLHIRPVSSTSSRPHRRALSQTSQPASTFSSAKAREAGFELEHEHPAFSGRSSSTSSVPSVTVLSSTEPLMHTREVGKATAYLIPFPKPRIKGVRPEDIPERFLVYTPLLPPLSKPAAGEDESVWHKTQRQWEEDVRKAMISKASPVSWKGMKARTTSLIHKGVNKTRSSNVEFLDRVSGGAITATTEEMGAEGSVDKISEAEVSAEPSSMNSPSETSIPPPKISRTSTSCPLDRNKDRENKPQALKELTLIYPPTLQLSPDKIRTEFVDTLLRTRQQSRKEALLASTLMPFAATLDACLVITLGGLTQASGVWAYTSARGAITSNRMTKGLARGESYASEKADEPECETETQGCTCGHHEHTYGAPATIPKPPKKPKKEKGKGINLQLQQSTHLEILRRYLDLACLKKDFHMFPHIEEAAGDVSEGTALHAIGWKPVLRQGRDLEVEFKDRTETMTSDEDELYQFVEARDDLKRYFKKGAAEWVSWCKSFKVGKESEGKGKR
jgi:hypothetical protein